MLSLAPTVQIGWRLTVVNTAINGYRAHCAGHTIVQLTKPWNQPWSLTDCWAKAVVLAQIIILFTCFSLKDNIIWIEPRRYWRRYNNSRKRCLRLVSVLDHSLPRTTSSRLGFESWCIQVKFSTLNLSLIWFLSLWKLMVIQW